MAKAGLHFEGVDRLVAKLKLKARKQQAKELGQEVIVVGYTQAYALYVHEDMEAKHTNGQAKYLETVTREKQQDIKRVLRQGYQSTGSIIQAMVLAGLYIQRESQKLVPVDTGALKNSAFTRKES